MLIVEGADFTGKTTLCELIEERLRRRQRPHQAFHAIRPSEDFDWFVERMRQVGVSYLYDRLHLSDVVYRCHDDRRCDITPMKMQLVDAAIRECCGYVVVVRCEAEEIIRRARVRGPDEMYSLEHVLSVAETFDQLAFDGRVDMRGDRYWLHADRICETTDVDLRDMPGLADDIVDEYLSRLEEFDILSKWVVG